MSAIDAGVVFLPRFTTLVGSTNFTTSPLDVSRQGGVQFQVWRGPIRTSSGSGSLTMELQESFDAQTWSLGASSAAVISLVEGSPHFFSYSFRLKWFRLSFALYGTGPMVSCWAEGLLRGGGEGMWGGMGPGGLPLSAVGAAGAVLSPMPSDPNRPELPWWRNSPPSGVSADLLYWSDPAYRAWVDSERQKQEAAAIWAANVERFRAGLPPPGSVPLSWGPAPPIGPGSTGPSPGAKPPVSNPFGP